MNTALISGQTLLCIGDSITDWLVVRIGINGMSHHLTRKKLSTATASALFIAEELYSSPPDKPAESVFYRLHPS